MELIKTDAVNKRIAEILKETDAERQRLKERVAELKASEDGFRAEMAKATEKTDAAAYRKGKQKLEDCLTEQEMCESRMNRLDKIPLVSEEEYEAIRGEILEELAGLEEETKQKLVEMAEAMYAVGKEYLDQRKAVNDTLARWHRDIFRWANVEYSKHGEPSRLKTKPGENPLVHKTDWQGNIMQKIKLTDSISALALDAVSGGAYNLLTGNKMQGNDLIKK